VALSLEVLFLGLSCAAALAAMRSVAHSYCCCHPLVLRIANIWDISWHFDVDCSVSAVLDAVLAFGVTALLYLVTEELLVEAHEVAETAKQTAIFLSALSDHRCWKWLYKSMPSQIFQAVFLESPALNIKCISFLMKRRLYLFLVRVQQKKMACAIPKKLAIIENKEVPRDYTLPEKVGLNIERANYENCWNWL